jgi:hypothetical protein
MNAIAQPGEKRFPDHYLEKVLLGLILLAAIFVRLWHLDLMEFKADEAEACRLAYHVLGQPLPDGDDRFPLAGLMASIGVRNPPLFIYVIAVPLAVARSPYAVVAFIAGCNLLAVWLCFLVGRRYFSPFVGLASAGLFALSPWAIIFSRKIWAQDLLPVFVGLFLLAAHAFLVDKRPSMLAWLMILAGAAVQLHFSALVLFGLLAYVLLTGKTTFRWRWFWVGTGVNLLLYAPYIYYVLGTQGSDFAHLAERQQQWSGQVGAIARAAWSARYTLAISSVDDTEYLTGIPLPFTLWISLITGAVWIWGLCSLYFRDRKGPLGNVRLLLLIWLVLPALGLVILGNLPFPHYFVILYPLPFLGLAVALEGVVTRRRAWGLALLGAVFASYAMFDALTFQSLMKHGGGAADYGIAYTYKAAAMDFILAENRDRPFVVSTDFNLQAEVPLEYKVLLWSGMRRDHWSSATTTPALAYVLLDTFVTTLSPDGERVVQGLRRQQFGPLTVYIVPLAQGPTKD